MCFYTSSRNILLVCKPLKMELICAQCQEIKVHINVSFFIIMQGEWVIENKILFLLLLCHQKLYVNFMKSENPYLTAEF